MLKNYFKTAIRNLRRNKTFAIINILGLILGISSTIVIYRIVTFEESFDTYHADADRVYRVNIMYESDGEEANSTSVMHPLRLALRNDFPDWNVAGIHWWDAGVFSVENAQGIETKIRETNPIAFVGSDFFEIFDFEVIAGGKEQLLAEPNTIAMSASSADKLFGLNGSGYQEIIGRTVKFENQLTLQIEAVYNDPPKNTDFDIDYMMFYEGAKIYPYAAELKSWQTINGAARLWVKLPEGLTEEAAQQQLKQASSKYLEELKSFVTNGYMALEPLSGIHLDEDSGLSVVDKSVISSLTVLGLILIITAAINFVNLATAQSVKRAKEIGIRKVLGSKKSHLIIQFLSEVFIITFISLIASLGVSEAVLMQLEPILGYNLGLNLLAEPGIVGFLLLLTLVVTLLSGFYPSMVLANYNPVTAIKSNSMASGSKSKSMSLRRVLVIIQFLISQTLIIGTLVIVYQMNFMLNKPLGFDTEAIVTFSVPERTEEKMSLLRSRMQEVAGVGDISFYVASPGVARTNNIDQLKDPKGGGAEMIRANRKNVDDQYAELFDLKILAGEFFRESSPNDNSVINKKLAESLGFESPEQAVGQRYETSFGRTYIITGVVDDFHNNSLRGEIDPVFMMSGTSQYFEGGVKLNLNDGFNDALTKLEEIWSEVFTADVFTYQFIDEKVVQQYQSEQRVTQLLQIFAGIAIFIGCLGLYGLVSFMANQKIKEIGIRKVLGATIGSILGIFSREVLILVAFAFLIAAPLGYYLMNQWLSNYVYQINIGPGVFAMAVGATVLIAAGTVGFRSVKAASANPVQSLRDE